MQKIDIGKSRLVSHHIADNRHETVADVLRWMGAMQAQDYKQALWAIGTRMQSATIDTVETAITNTEIVRTWSQRGTIHFVPAEDTLWMLELCASRSLLKHDKRMAQLDLTEEIMEQCEDDLKRALSGGKSLTRAEIFSLFNEKGIATQKQRGYHILWHIAHKGVICMGAMQRNEQTFVLLDEWVSNLRILSHDEALNELVKRFFKSHAPATDYDFARWSGLTLTDTRAGLKANAESLASFNDDDMTYWFDPSQEPTSQDTQSVYLLAAFDEYLLGYKDRSSVLADEHAEKVVPGNNGVFQPLVVVDGQVTGIWKRTLKKTSVDINLYPFTSFGDAKDAIITQAETYADFMGLSLNITFDD
ncbi:MAG: winged helix DNA-binding domain-containing protein [Phototrophicaceae bacterium]